MVEKPSVGPRRLHNRDLRESGFKIRTAEGMRDAAAKSRLGGERGVLISDSDGTETWRQA
jgi:hypothetical protein